MLRGFMMDTCRVGLLCTSINNWGAPVICQGCLPSPRRPPRILTTNPKLCNLYTDTWNLLHWTHILSNMINHVNNNMFIKCCLKIRRRRRRNIICLLSSIKISYISWYLTCKIPKISKCAILTVPKAFKNSINTAKIIYYGEIMMATKF